MDIDLNRGLTRLYVLLWAMWLGYLLLLLPRAVMLVDTLIRIGLVGILLPALLLLALKWVGAGFRSSRETGS